MFIRQTKAAALSATLVALFITKPTSSDKGKLVIYLSFDLQSKDINHKPYKRTTGSIGYCDTAYSDNRL